MFSCVLREFSFFGVFLVTATRNFLRLKSSCSSSLNWKWTHDSSSHSLSLPLTLPLLFCSPSKISRGVGFYLKAIAFSHRGIRKLYANNNKQQTQKTKIMARCFFSFGYEEKNNKQISSKSGTKQRTASDKSNELSFQTHDFISWLLLDFRSVENQWGKFCVWPDIFMCLCLPASSSSSFSCVSNNQ